jgi:hypothetical protein
VGGVGVGRIGVGRPGFVGGGVGVRRVGVGGVGWRRGFFPGVSIGTAIGIGAAGLWGDDYWGYPPSWGVYPYQPPCTCGNPWGW